MKRILLILTLLLSTIAGFAQQADVVVTITDNQTVYVPGTTLTYTVNVTNFGPNRANGVQVTSPVPPGLISGYYWEGSNNTFGTNEQLSDKIRKLDEGEFVTYTITIDVPGTYTGDLELQVTANSVGMPAIATTPATPAAPAVNDPQPSSNSASDLDVKGVADIVVVNTDNSNVYVPGQASVYTVTVTNNGPTDALNVLVRNLFPIGIDAADFSWTGSNGSSGNGVILYDTIDVIALGETITYTITINVPSDFASLLINKTEVFATSSDPTPADMTSTDSDFKTVGADVVTTNTDGQDFYVVGQPRVYTITVTNNGAEVATNVEVTNAIPAGITTMSWSGNSASGNGALNNTIPTLAVGASVVYTVTLQVPLTFTGDLVNQTIVTTGSIDPNPGCVGCIDIDTAGADIVVTNTNNRTVYVGGETSTYTVTVTNNGPSDATNVNVTNTFPAGVDIVSWSGSNGTNGGSDFSDTIATLTNGTTITYTVTVQISNTFSGNLTSQVVVTSDTTDPVPSCPQCADTDTKRITDIQITNTDGQITYNNGVANARTYTVAVTNNGPADALNVQVTNPIPAGATQFSWSGSNGTSGTTGINTTIPSLPVGASVVYTINLTIPSAFNGNFTSTASANSTFTTDSNTANNQAIDTDTPAITADIVVINTNGQDVYTPGTVTVYTVTVTNNGPKVATGVEVTFPLPAGITTMSWSGNTASGSGAMTNTIATLAVGASVTYTVTVTIPPTFVGNLTTVAGATSTTTDPNAANSQSTDVDVLVAPSADVSITNTNNQTSYVSGTTVIYKVIVTNNGPQAAASVQVTNPIPAGITSFSWTGTNGSSGNNVNLDNTIMSLANGQTVTYTITVQIPVGYTGNLQSVANANTTSTDPTPANNSVTDTDTPAQSDIVVTNTSSNAAPQKGTFTTFTVTVTNNGPNDARTVNVSNPLPAGITTMSWTGSNGSSGTGALANTIALLTTGSTVTYTITVFIPGTFTGSINSTASVTSATFDPNAANSSATLTPTTTPANLPPGSDVSVTITDPTTFYVAGQTGTYTVTVTNNGPSAANGILVETILPSEILPANYTWSGNSTSGSGAISNTIPTLAVGQSVVYTISIVVPSDFDQETNIVNTATATPTSTDAVMSNNTVTAVDTPNPFADLVVKKTDNKTTFNESRQVDDDYNPNSPIPGIEENASDENASSVNFINGNVFEYNIYKITIINNGPSDAVNVVVSDPIPVNPIPTNSQILPADVTWFSSRGTNGTGNILETIDNFAVGEVITYTVKVKIPQNYNINSTSNVVNTVTVSSDTGDANISNNTSSDVDTPDSKFLYVNNDELLYSPNYMDSGIAEGFIKNVLVRSNCAEVYDFEMGSDPADPKAGVAYFNRKNSSFPIEDGIVLVAGAAQNITGPNPANAINSDSPGWNVDHNDLTNPLLSPPIGLPNGQINDPSYLKFKFVPSTSKLSFNFILAAEEYSWVNGYECFYFDPFAFILTDLTDPSITPKNLAVVPNLPNTPITIGTIHLQTPSCAPANPQYFGKYNFDHIGANQALRDNSPIAINGQTKLLTAKGDVIPGHEYSIKLIVADKGDHAFNSAVFIQGGSFEFDSQIADASGVVNFGPGQPICFEEEKTLYMGDPLVGPLSNGTYSWEKDGVKIDGANEFSLVVTQSGRYTATITFATGCKKSDDIEVVFTDPIPTEEPNPVYTCDNSGGPYSLNIDQTTLMLNGLSSLDYEVLYYQTEQDAKDYGLNDIFSTNGNLSSFPVTQAELPKTIYVRITDVASSSQCASFKQFVLDNFTPEGTISYTPGNYCNVATSVPVTNSPNLTPGGEYSATPPGLYVDPITGDINPSLSLLGTYQVIYTIEGGDCPDFITPPATVVIEPCCTTTAPADFAVCQGSPIPLSATSSDGTATFTWTGLTDGFSSSDQNTVVPAPLAAGVYTYEVVSTISGGGLCSSDMVNVTVHPIPDANFVTISQAACTNSTVLIELTGLPDAFVTYNFNENGVTGQNTIQLSSATSPAPGTASFTTAALTQDSTYELVSVSSNTTPSCNFTFAPGTSITITVGLPDGSIGVPDEPTICAGDDTFIPVTGSPGATIAYSWQNASGTVTGSGSVTIANDGNGQITTGILNETTTYNLTNVTSTGTPSCSKPLTGQTATVTVNPLPQVTGFTSDVTSVCPNGPVMLSFTGTAGATVTFTDGTTSTNVPIDATGIGATTLNLTADTTFTITGITSGDTPSCPGTGPFPVAVTVTVDVLASVTDPSDQELCPGDTFTTFTVTGSGTNISYQWFGPSGQLTDSAHISGSTTNTLVINAPTGADAGGYYVVVSNICTNATSATAQLAVDAPIVIVAPLPTGGTICEGDTISLTANATGVALTYQWYGPSGQLSDSGNVSGSGTPTLTVSNVSLNDAGTYYCIVNNACNQPQQTQDAYFIINEKPQITQQPTTVQSDYCAGETVTIDVVATGTGLTYQWYKGSTATPVTGNATATTNQLVLTGTAVSDSGSYFVVVSGTCLPVQTSTAVTVTVKEAPSIVAQPQDVTICATETIDLSVITPSGTSFTFQWRHNGADLVGENLSTLSIPNATLADAGDYTVVVGNGGICPDIESEVAVVVVNQAPVITVQPLPLDVCVGNTIILTTDAAGNNITYQWQFNNVDIDGVVNPSALTNILEIQNADFVNAGNYTCIVSSASCPPLTTNVARVAVIALPVATIANGNEPVICAGSAADVIVSGTANAIVTYTINGGAPQTVTISPSGTAIIATGIIDATATYELLSVVRGENPPCPNSLVGGAQSVAVVTVNPLPGTELDQDGYICVDPITGATFRTYTLDTGFPNDGTYSFEWFLDTVSQPQFSNQPVIEADTVGTYMVTVTDLGSGCVQSATAPIVSSSPPLSITLEAMTSYFDENATIAVTVDPPGDYEYRIDDGPYQESNVFEGVRTVLNFNDTGTHTVYVRDAKVCGEVTESITIIDYPKYFTPNGDGFHDTWNISTLRGQPNTKIYIFDRFGKLIKQISTEGLGWDGTYNGKPIVADDYWFVVKYSEAGINKEFKAHFSLKR